MGAMGRKVCLLAVLFVCMAAGGLAQRIEVYIAPGALEAGEAERMTALLGEAFPQEEWTLAQGDSLRQLIMEDRVPGLAICPPGEAMPWAREGLILPLEGWIADAARIQQEALQTGVWAERLYAVPLAARHRRAVVNADKLREMQMRHLLDRAAYPVWQPVQLDQVLEECFLNGETGMELWPPEAGGSAAVEALLQALCGGRWIAEAGGLAVSAPESIAAMRWLKEMMQNGLIGCAESREEALSHFLDGETTIFIDWTDEEERRQRQKEGEEAFERHTMPYPASDGLPVRAFDLTSLCVFDAGDTAANTALLRAAAFLHEDDAVQALLGGRGIWRDGAVWLAPLDADDCGATLRGLMNGALRDVMRGEGEPIEALMRVQAAMRAAGYR